MTCQGETFGNYIRNHVKTCSDELKAVRAAAEKLDTLIQESGIDPEEIIELLNDKRRKAK